MKCTTTLPVLLCVFALAGGCPSTQNFDNSRLTITPGVGIKGIIELGMSLPDVGRRAPDLLIHENDNPDPYYRLDEGWIWGFDIPSLGIFCGQMRRNAPLTTFSFDIDGPGSQSPSPRSSRPSFRGKVAHKSGQMLSFHGPGTVSRCDVIRAFGTPDRVIDFTPYMQRSGWLRDVGPALASSLQQGHSVETVINGQCLSLYYPRDGISFNFEEGRVRSVGVP